MADHSTLGASGAHRWMQCPGSIRLSQGIPQTSSVYAEEGSAAHYLAELCLRHKHDAREFLGNYLVPLKNSYQISLGETGEGSFEITEEMCEAVQIYLDAIRADMAENPTATLSIEKKFNLDELFPGMFGTNDACLEEAFGLVRVYDFKYGAGKVVEVEDNPQLKYYALGAYYGLDFDSVELVIVQPRARHRDGPVRRYQLPIVDLRDWAQNVLLPAAKATQAPDAPAVAGDWCRFCVVMPQCPALRDHALEVAKSDLSTIPLPAPELLGMTDLVKVLQSEDLLSSWLNSVSAYARGLLEKGEKIPGYKLVRGKANRVWGDPKQVEQGMLKYAEWIYEKKILSPAKMEKLVKQKGWTVPLDEWIEKPEGKLTIAPEADKRPAVEVGPIVDMFDTALIEDF